MRKNSLPLSSPGADLAESLQERMMAHMAENMQKEIDQNLIWEVIMETKPGWHPVQLEWNKSGDEDYFWNEACAWAVENFGLPGDRYVTHPNERYMLFLFKNSKDAVMMTLKWT
jgi:hypothetical protein